MLKSTRTGRVDLTKSRSRRTSAATWTSTATESGTVGAINEATPGRYLFGGTTHGFKCAIRKLDSQYHNCRSIGKLSTPGTARSGRVGRWTDDPSRDRLRTGEGARGSF